METMIRKGSVLFYTSDDFPYGIARSSYFNKRESEELIQYGHTFSCLQNGTLEPENEEELEFVAAINNGFESARYSVLLWKKYLAAAHKRRTFHSFSMSSRNMRIPSSNASVFEHAG